MSDAYGTITFKKSANSSFDSSLLAQELNSFDWSKDGTKWLVDEESESLYLDSSNPQYPLAILNMKNLFIFAITMALGLCLRQAR